MLQEIFFDESIALNLLSQCPNYRTPHRMAQVFYRPITIHLCKIQY